MTQIRLIFALFIFSEKLKAENIILHIEESEPNILSGFSYVYKQNQALKWFAFCDIFINGRTLFYFYIIGILSMFGVATQIKSIRPAIKIFSLSVFDWSLADKLFFLFTIIDKLYSGCQANEIYALHKISGILL